MWGIPTGVDGDDRCPGKGESGITPDLGPTQINPDPKGTTVRITLSSITPLLVAGAAATAIVAAPTAAAADVQSCGSVMCASPDDVQIDSSPPAVAVGPYGPLYTGYARGHD